MMVAAILLKHKVVILTPINGFLINYKNFLIPCYENYITCISTQTTDVSIFFVSIKTTKKIVIKMSLPFL